LFEIEMVIDLGPVSAPKATVDDGAGVDENAGTAEHVKVYDSMGLDGSLVRSTSVSTLGVAGVEPIGGEQRIDTMAGGAPSMRPLSGRPDETENHDPTANADS